MNLNSDEVTTLFYFLELAQNFDFLNFKMEDI